MDRQALKDAAELLINSDDYIGIRKKLTEMLNEWPSRPTMFGGDMMCLNVLIDLGLKSRETLAGFFKLIDTKRRTRVGSKKVDYQRDYMRQRRTRMVKAAKLEEIVRGKPMGREEREGYMAAMWAEWMVKRNEHVAKHPEADWKTRNRIVGEFWQQIDNQLDNDLEEARKVLSYPEGRKKRVVKVKPEKVTTMREAFRKARKK